MKASAAFVSITLACIAVATIAATLPPSPLPTTAPADGFSAERAIEHIRVIAAEPRPTGSVAFEIAREYVLSVLEDMGVETATQEIGAVENTLGWISGSESAEVVLLTAHLDSVSESPGASDDASGVAVLLETARALKSGPPLRNTVMFLFTDNEEGGSVGAEAFVADQTWARNVRVVIGFDAGGLSGPCVLSATSSQNGWLIRQLARADRYVTGSSAINALADSGTDFGHAFKRAGFPGYAFDLYWDRRIHTPQDTVENLTPSSIQHQGYHALSLARRFGDLGQLADPREPDAVYFGILRLFTVAYSSTWALPLAIAFTLAFGGVVAFGLLRGILTWGGIAYGTFVLLAGLIIAPLPSLLLRIWTPGIPLRFVGRSLDQPPQVGAVVAATLALTMLWYFVAGRIRSTSVPDLTIGALVPMLSGAVGTSIAFPALSFGFTWPMMFSLLACAVCHYWGGRRDGSRAAAVGLALAGAANIVVLGPTIILGLFDQMPPALLLLGVLCGFLVPQLHLILGRSWRNQEHLQERGGT